MLFLMLLLQYATSKLWKVVMVSLHSKSFVIKGLYEEWAAHFT